MDGKYRLYALVPIPAQVARFWPLGVGEGRGKGPKRFASLEAVLALFLDHLFPGCAVVERGVFRLIRDSDIEIEEEAEDLVREFEARLKQRRLGSVVRIEIESSMPEELRVFITQNLHAQSQDVILVEGVLGLDEDSSGLIADRSRRPGSSSLGNSRPASPGKRIRDQGGERLRGRYLQKRTSWSTTRSKRASDMWWSQFLRQAARDPNACGHQADPLPDLEGQPDRRRR